MGQTTLFKTSKRLANVCGRHLAVILLILFVLLNETHEAMHNESQKVTASSTWAPRKPDFRRPFKMPPNSTQVFLTQPSELIPPIDQGGQYKTPISRREGVLRVKEKPSQVGPVQTDFQHTAKSELSSKWEAYHSTTPELHMTDLASSLLPSPAVTTTTNLNTASFYRDGKDQLALSSNSMITFSNSVTIVTSNASFMATDAMELLEPLDHTSSSVLMLWDPDGALISPTPSSTFIPSQKSMFMTLSISHPKDALIAASSRVDLTSGTTFQSHAPSTTSLLQRAVSSDGDAIPMATSISGLFSTEAPKFVRTHTEDIAMPSARLKTVDISPTPTLLVHASISSKFVLELSDTNSTEPPASDINSATDHEPTEILANPLKGDTFTSTAPLQEPGIFHHHEATGDGLVTSVSILSTSPVNGSSSSALDDETQRSSGVPEDEESLQPSSDSQIGTEEAALPAGTVAGIVIASIGFIVILASAAGLYIFKRFNGLGHKKYENKFTNDTCSYLDSLQVSYINNHIEMPKESSDEMISLDNDSFLNSLEAMTMENYWTDNRKSTKV